MSRAVAEAQRQQPPEPDFRSQGIEHSPIDPERQTGESRLLGGEMRVRAPYSVDWEGTKGQPSEDD